MSVFNVKPGLLSHSLEQQTLVYDPASEQIHLLDPVSARVLKLLQDGIVEESDLIDHLREMTVEGTTELLSLALHELSEAGLLVGEKAGSTVSQTRREMIRKLATAGAAAVLVPAITTVAARPVYAQASCIAKNDGPCFSNTVCCPGLTCNLSNNKCQ
jgi:hypothetical protein